MEGDVHFFSVAFYFGLCAFLLVISLFVQLLFVLCVVNKGMEVLFFLFRSISVFFICICASICFDCKWF